MRSLDYPIPPTLLRAGILTECTKLYSLLSHVHCYVSYWGRSKYEYPHQPDPILTLPKSRFDSGNIYYSQRPDSLCRIYKQKLLNHHRKQDRLIVYFKSGSFRLFVDDHRKLLTYVRRVVNEYKPRVPAYWRWRDRRSHRGCRLGGLSGRVSQSCNSPENTKLLWRRTGVVPNSRCLSLLP